MDIRHHRPGISAPQEVLVVQGDRIAFWLARALTPPVEEGLGWIYRRAQSAGNIFTCGVVILSLILPNLVAACFNRLVQLQTGHLIQWVAVYSLAVIAVSSQPVSSVLLLPPARADARALAPKRKFDGSGLRLSFPDHTSTLTLFILLRVIYWRLWQVLASERRINNQTSGTDQITLAV